MKKRLQDVMNNHEAMSLEEKVQGDLYLEEHDRYADALNKDLQALDEDGIAKVSTICKEGEMISLEQWKNEFVCVKGKVVAEINRDEDMAPCIN